MYSSETRVLTVHSLTQGPFRSCRSVLNILSYWTEINREFKTVIAMGSTIILHDRVKAVDNWYDNSVVPPNIDCIQDYMITLAQHFYEYALLLDVYKEQRKYVTKWHLKRITQISSVQALQSCIVFVSYLFNSSSVMRKLSYQYLSV